MHFWKYCGAGNDFVILENFDGSIAPERYAALAAALCREHFSVGADGLMVLEPPAQGGDCRMRFYNRDGSTAEMCGNGARCLCRHCHDRGLASGPVQHIETPAGLVTGRRITADRYRIRLNRPSVVRLHVEAEGVRCAYLELGEPGIPHAVVLTELDRPRAELRELAARLRGRGTEDEAAVQKRLARAEEELREKDAYDFAIVNDDARRCAVELYEILRARQSE